MLPNVISEHSLDSESFNQGLLDYPVYTKPRDYRGFEVPDVLLSGNHQKIEKFRKNEAIKLTKENRPDLWEKYNE